MEENKNAKKVELPFKVKDYPEWVYLVKQNLTIFKCTRTPFPQKTKICNYLKE